MTLQDSDSKIFYKVLNSCTCAETDDDPLAFACDYCLAERGLDGYFTREQLMYFVRQEIKKDEQA